MSLRQNAQSQVQVRQQDEQKADDDASTGKERHACSGIGTGDNAEPNELQGEAAAHAVLEMS